MFVPESFEAQILIKVSKDQIKETAERSIIETSKCSFTHKHSISDDIRHSHLTHKLIYGFCFH